MIEAKSAVIAKVEFLKCKEEHRTQAIEAIAEGLMNNIEQILNENKKDVAEAHTNQLSSAIIDRLVLNEDRLKDLVKSVYEISKQPQVVGEITESHTRSDGLKIQKQRIPLGVIGMIFESRPNVVIDCSCLAIKSGNCIILKGGKEAHHSNAILVQIVREAIKKHIPENVVQLIESREDVSLLLKQVGLVDVIIPRGGEKLIEHVYHHSKIPVIAHFKGLCHIFVDESANLEQATSIILNAKTQRPGVCNAVETLLLHEKLPQSFIDTTFKALKEKACELRVCSNTRSSVADLIKATEEDWATEYLDNILSVKTVKDIDEAISHIQKFGSHHTEAILSQDLNRIQKFESQVDASSIMINASTRFNDGGQLGLGAELGISTTKLHAYGPMGAKQMCTQRFVVKGNGHTRS